MTGYRLHQRTHRGWRLSRREYDSPETAKTAIRQRSKEERKRLRIVWATGTESRQPLFEPLN